MSTFKTQVNYRRPMPKLKKLGTGVNYMLSKISWRKSKIPQLTQ